MDRFNLNTEFCKQCGFDGKMCDGCKKKKCYQQGRAEAIDEVENALLENGFIFTEHALKVWKEIAAQLKEEKND